MEKTSESNDEMQSSYQQMRRALFFENPDFDAAKKILACGFDINQKSEKSGFKWTLLHEAARTSYRPVDIVQFLLAHGAQKNMLDAFGKSPLTYAMDKHNGFEELISLLR